ncbi:MAG: hypothetical protein AAGF11_19470 [Myxococcota bacterium]
MAYEIVKRIRPAGIALVLAGCIDRPPLTDSDTGGDGTADSSAPTTADTMTSVGTTGSTGSATFSADSTDGGLTTGTSNNDGTGGFPCDPQSRDHWHCLPDDGTPAFECDMFAQDCIDGEKCMPWSNEAGPAWNATRCSEIDPLASAVGEPCTVVALATSGLDSCGPRALCWGVDPTTLEGECVAMCTNNEADPQCEEPGTHCVINNDGAIILCLPDCDPLASDCAAGELCVPDSPESWACVPATMAPVANAQPCQFGNACEPGSVCAEAGVSVACESAACCVPTCALGGGGCSDPGTECVPWYPPGAAPMGLEGTGLCANGPVPPKAGWVDIYNRFLIADLGG